MSKPVNLDELAIRVRDFGSAYLTTIGDNDRIHTVPVNPVMGKAGLSVAGLGRRTQANATARPGVCLVWPPRDADGYSLIVDGTALLEGTTLRLTPTRAILHKAALGDGAAEGDACLADCVEI
jgi:hypothetical protein